MIRKTNTIKGFVLIFTVVCLMCFLVQEALASESVEFFPDQGYSLPFELYPDADIVDVLADDFNGDGYCDIVACGDYGSENGIRIERDSFIAILFNQGDGTFGEHVLYHMPSNGVRNMALGDFNEDGKPDLAVVAFEESGVRVLLNQGDGVFDPDLSVHYSTGGGREYVNFRAWNTPAAVAASDFDQDGHLDLAVNNDSEGKLCFLMGDGTGGFSPASPEGPFADIPLEFNSYNMIAHDLFRCHGWEDGYPDLVLAGDYKVNILKNTGGNIEIIDDQIYTGRIIDISSEGEIITDNEHLFADIFGTGPVYDIVAGQFDYDTGHDIIAGNGSTGPHYPLRAFVKNYMNEDLSVMEVEFDNGFGATGGTTAFAVGDFNGDGYPDLVRQIGDGPVGMHIMLGLPRTPPGYLAGYDNMHFQDNGIISMPDFYDNAIPICTAVGDFDNDGRSDVVTGFRDAYGDAEIKVSLTKYLLPITDLTVTGTGGVSSVQVGSTLQMLADVLPANATDKSVTWSIQSGSGASINSDGLLTATAAGSVTVRATANDGSGVYGEKTVTITSTPITTYTITATAGSGGSISPSGAASVTSGSSQTFTITPDSGYRINSVKVDGVNQGAITTYTFTNVTANHTINATFTRTSSGGGGTSSTPSTPTAPDYKAEVKEGNDSETTLSVTVDTDTGTASVDAGSQNLASGTNVMITMPSVPGVTDYNVGMPVASLTTPNGGTLTFNTDTGSLTLPSDMLSGIPGLEGKNAEITIGVGDKSDLPDSVKEDIGDRPLIQLTLSIDGKQTDWSNPSAPVTVSIPYTPTAAELANPESIVVWYIDGSGNVVAVPNGRYDAVTGTVSFFTTHFSGYAVTYVHKTFSDLGSVEWARMAIEVMASKGITNGTGDGTTFSPTVNITRADFMVLLIKTLGLTAEFTENFDDVQPGSYYYDAIGVAKKLGIAAGRGNNCFNPTENISRQDMMVLAARALEKYQRLETADTNTVLERFTDRKEIAEYAAQSFATLIETGLTEGSGGRLTPRAYTTRAEVAAFLYKIYNEYPNAPAMTASILTRLAGQSRIDTALATARAAYPDEISNAVIATADNYPDALAGSVLAYQLEAPILLEGSTETEQAVISYLKEKLRPDGTVYILGGPGVVSQAFEDRLSTSGIASVSRLAGNDRYETSVKIAEHLNVKTGTPVVLVSGEHYPDALAVSSIAAQRGWPILLVQKDGISEAVSRKLAGIKPERICIIGLEGAIGKSVESQAAKLTGLAAEDIVRLGGNDRYSTSLAVAEYFNLGSQTIFLATGSNFPDALAGSVYAAKQKAPIILTDSTLPAQTADYVESRKPVELTILGGEAVVGSGIEGQILQLLRQ